MIEELLDIVKEAGDIAIEHQNKLQKDTKEDESLVTNGDLAVSKFLEEKLSKYYPVLSEENYNEELIDEKKIFIIDPIDGTISYSKKQESWTILVSLVENNQPILGIIFQPSTGKLYFAEKGKGAFLEYKGERNKIRVNSNLKKTLLSPSNKDKERQDYVVNKIQSEENIYHFGAGIKMALIAEGAADAYVSVSHKCSVWDVMAGWCLIKEAGGQLNFHNNYKINLKKPLLEVDFIAANKKIDFNF